MNVAKRLLLIILAAFGWMPLSAGNDFCGVRNQAFLPGEVISYQVFYNVIGLYVSAGTATFTTSLERYNNKPVYHFIGTGNSNSNYDWIFKVRDRYETWVDTATLQPYKFIRHVEEGSYRKHQVAVFDQLNNVVNTEKGNFKLPNCVQDVVSSIYYARNIDFSKYKVGDKIPFNMFLDDDVYNIYIRYLGRETIKTKYGKFRAIKFAPLLVQGTMFKGGEDMRVWVTDDANKIPVRIESPISVGSVKVDMMSYKNLRHPFTALASWR